MFSSDPDSVSEPKLGKFVVYQQQQKTRVSLQRCSFESQEMSKCRRFILMVTVFQQEGASFSFMFSLQP